jgi:hypothetical protein
MLLFSIINKVRISPCNYIPKTTPADAFAPRLVDVFSSAVLSHAARGPLCSLAVGGLSANAYLPSPNLLTSGELAKISANGESVG